MTTPGELFTAAQIASALGCTKQNVHQRLAAVPADGEQINGGNLAKAWRIDSLPPTILRQLSDKADAKRYRTVADLLREPFNRYETPIPLPEIAPQALERARKLRAAMHDILPLRNDSSISAEQLAKKGVAAYKRELGTISAHHWRRLLNRTIDRDNGSEEWSRLEIYVEENPPSVSSTRPMATARERGLEVLEDAFTELKGVTELNVEQKVYLWTKACDELHLQIENRAAEKKTKRAILKTLLASGLLGADKETIRRNLNRQWAKFVGNGRRSLIDKRTLRKKDPMPEHDFNVIAGHTVARGGVLTAGWEAARSSGDLSAETDQRYATNVFSVPNRVRRLAPVIKSVLPLVKGERAFRADGPCIRGDYSNLYSGVMFEMDDWTPEHVCWDVHEDGRPGFRFLQGQLILVLDVASRRVLEASFTEGAYSARMIRGTLNRACQNYCLCEILNIESGLWKRARLIVGRKIISHDQWEMGLREFMTVKNARRPQAKANIENHFHALGKIMRTNPGWCGNDMRKTMPEELKRKIAKAEAGELHPSEFCLRKDHLVEALMTALAEYNAKPQHRGRLQGLSPNEAWHAKQSPTGRPSLGDKAAYLLAYHREAMRVRKSEIVKKIAGIKHVYHSPEVSRYNNRSVLVWWNPVDLDQIAISSLDRKEGPFVVPVQSKTAVTASPDYDAIGTAQAKIDDTLEVRRAIFRSIQPWLAKARLRPTLIDSSTANFGEKLETDVDLVKRRVESQKRIVDKTRRLVRDRGINVRVDAKNAERAAASAELIDEAYEDVNR